MIYIIRPEVSAKETQIILTKAGHLCHILPITQIVPLTENIHLFEKALAEKSQNIVFTSSNALGGLSYGDYAQHQVFCVGEKTAQKAREIGFRTIRIANPENIQGLTALIMSYKPASVLYGAGLNRKPHLEAFLKYHNIHCFTYPLYEAQAIEQNDKMILEKLLSDPDVHILCFSLRHTQLFYDILCHSGLDLNVFHRLRWHIIGEETVFGEGRYVFYRTPQELYNFFVNQRPII